MRIDRRAGQRCFGLLALINRPQVRYIHFPERIILPGSFIPSDKYNPKEFNLCGTCALVWLRHHAVQILYVARVPGYVKVTAPWPCKGFDQRGDVTTRVDTYHKG